GLGAFAGQRLDLLQRSHSAVFAAEGLGWYDRVPGGEGFMTLAARCRDLLGALDRPALIVGHGITLRMIWALALGRDLAHLAEAPVAQGQVLVLRGGRSEVWRHPDEQI
ncbi:MAG: histidine phosphatase family protein, partial [Paracoccus sp. (in: a-proteobacteria)]